MVGLKQIAAIAALPLVLSACTTNPYTGEQQASRTAIGAGLGAGLGALSGLLVASATDADARKAALIGAGIGGLTGGGIGVYMDQQEAELRQQLQGTGVSVTRSGDSLILNMPSNITFDVNQSNVKGEFFGVLDSVAIVLNKFNKSLIDVYGHTDSDGSDAANQTLSEQRALSVANYLNGKSVDGRRMRVQGFGESRPIASNATSSGKAQNRRVELQIVPLVQG